MPSVHFLESRFDSAWPVASWCDSHVVLAVSAGADSVAMMRAAMTLQKKAGGGTLFVAHLNHALRGSDADADEAWLRGLCQRLNVQLEVGQANVAEIAAQHGDGLEAAARTARYDFLRQTAERLGARFVATAHTRDDQVETILHRIVRGTGLTGLAGMARIRPLSPSVTLARPLLDVKRSEVLEYLAAIGQDYRLDASNADLRFMRNRLRHELLPVLREHYNADADAALLRLATQARESQQLIADLAAGLAQRSVAVEHGARSHPGGCREAHRAQIDCSKLSSQPPLVVREVCKLAWKEARWPRQAMGFDAWQQLADLIRRGADLPAINLPGNIRARREGRLLILERLGLA